MIRGSLKVSALCSVMAVHQSDVGGAIALKLNMIGLSGNRGQGRARPDNLKQLERSESESSLVNIGVAGVAPPPPPPGMEMDTPTTSSASEPPSEASSRSGSPPPAPVEAEVTTQETSRIEAPDVEQQRKNSRDILTTLKSTVRSKTVSLLDNPTAKVEAEKVRNLLYSDDAESSLAKNRPTLLAELKTYLKAFIQMFNLKDEDLIQMSEFGDGDLIDLFKTAFPMNIAYITDIEGDMEFFSDWLLKNMGVGKAFKQVPIYWQLGKNTYPTFKFNSDGTPQFDLFLNKGWGFVFGGDSVDKGGRFDKDGTLVEAGEGVGGSIRVVQTLVKLKEDYIKRGEGDRVTLILGNRDVNKMRLTSELDDEMMKKSALDKVPAPHWDLNRPTPTSYVTKEKENDASGNTTNLKYIMLKYMLTQTYGAPHEIYLRAKELQLLNQSASQTNETAVVQSFIDSVSKDECGFMRKLIQYGDLAKIIGKTLYVHGGLFNATEDESEGASIYKKTSLGRVPVPGGPDGGYTSAPIETNVSDWVTKLNTWKNRQVDEWLADAGRTWKDSATSPAKVTNYNVGHSERGGQQLMAYAISEKGPPSVITGRHLDAQSMPMKMSQTIKNQLIESDIYRVIVGHTPHGSVPTVIPEDPMTTVASNAKANNNNSDGKQVVTILVDTCMGGNKGKRGDSMPLVNILGTGEVLVDAYLGSDYSLTVRNQYTTYSLPLSHLPFWVGKEKIIDGKTYFVKGPISASQSSGATAEDVKYLALNIGPDDKGVPGRKYTHHIVNESEMTLVKTFSK